MRPATRPPHPGAGRPAPAGPAAPLPGLRRVPTRPASLPVAGAAQRHGAAADPVLLVVAHGSRDPRHAATVSALAARVRSLRPGLRVETAFLDFNAPRVDQVLGRLAAGAGEPVQGTDAGHQAQDPAAGVRGPAAGAAGREVRVVALPLLLARAFHAKTDVPAVLAEAAARHPRLAVCQADVLGPSPLLVSALERRLREAGLRPSDRSTTGVVLASAGSSDPEARASSFSIAEEWQRAGWWAVRPAFASASPPRTEDAVRALRAEGARRVAVAPYVIAPGRLPDRIAEGAREAGADLLAAELGPAPELAALLLRRYDEARVGRDVSRTA